MRKLQVADAHEVKLDNSNRLFDSSEIKNCTLPLPSEGTSLNIIFKDDHKFDLSYLY